MDRALGVGGAVGHVVVGEVDGRHHPHAHVVEGLHQRQVAGDRRAVLHADVDEALAALADGLGLVGLGGQGEDVVVLGDHLVDHHGPQQGMVARGDIALLGVGALRGEHHEETAVDAAVDHARIVDLAAVLDLVAGADVEAGVRLVRRGVEVGVQHDQVLMQDPGLRLHLGGLSQDRRGAGEQNRERKTKLEHERHSPKLEWREPSAFRRVCASLSCPASARRLNFRRSRS